jgi:hypothetical protein
MMRASTVRPAFDSARQWSQAWREMQKWPFKWTRSTASHSSSEHDTNMRSRTKPALFTTTSRRPKASSVAFTSAPVCAKSATSAPFAIASRRARSLNPASAGRRDRRDRRFDAESFDTWRQRGEGDFVSGRGRSRRR